MKKKELLKLIAETAYNAGFGAKRHFATYDIVSKIPGLIGITSTSVGIIALFNEALGAKWLSAAFIILGYVGSNISVWDHKKQIYAETGTKLTKLFDQLKVIYLRVKSDGEEGASLPEDLEAVQKIQNELCDTGLTDQILFSDWYAHYKFFWQHQIEWVHEQKKFTFWRDKVPLSFTVTIALAILITIGALGWHFLPCK